MRITETMGIFDVTCSVGSVPPDAIFSEMPKILRHQLSRSRRNDPEQWWKEERRKIGKVTAISNRQCSLTD